MPSLWRALPATAVACERGFMLRVQGNHRRPPPGGTAAVFAAPGCANGARAMPLRNLHRIPIVCLDGPVWSMPPDSAGGATRRPLRHGRVRLQELQDPNRVCSHRNHRQVPTLRQSWSSAASRRRPRIQ
eukprot:Amastigsp_a346961_166.p3 type:complete len:129 gc:universal Amastigsp_a346961_166:634-248(-)